MRVRLTFVMRSVVGLPHRETLATLYFFPATPPFQLKKQSYVSGPCPNQSMLIVSVLNSKVTKAALKMRLYIYFFTIVLNRLKDL